jgi:hypothetical protein
VARQRRVNSSTRRPTADDLVDDPQQVLFVFERQHPSAATYRRVQNLLRTVHKNMFTLSSCSTAWRAEAFDLKRTNLVQRFTFFAIQNHTVRPGIPEQWN